MSVRRYFHDIIQTRTVDGFEILNLTKSIQISDLLDDVHTEEYVIKDGDYPDTLSKQYYNDTIFWWVFFLVNNLNDPFYDWPLNYESLKSYFAYLIETGELTDTPSNWASLKSANNDKRTIKILKEEYLDELLFILKERLNG